MRYQKSGDPGGPGKEKKTAELRAGGREDEACRCKEASRMSPRQLLRLMVGDLAFWKKAKKD